MICGIVIQMEIGLELPEMSKSESFGAVELFLTFRD